MSKKQFGASGGSKQQPSSVTFFVDRCLGAYDLPTLLRDAGLLIEVHKDQNFSSDADDDEWLPIVGNKGWAILTKDKQIRSRQIEVAALLRSGAPSFVLNSGNTTATENAFAILKALPQMLGCIRSHERPFVAQITGTGILTMLATRSALIKRID